MPRSSLKSQPRVDRNDRKQSGSGLSRERIAADLTAFRKAGGKIEVLGNTNTLKKISE
ncbi:hypothetical protein [Stenotrophomonas sp. Marseille-Q4652]|jgi:hypothetical protein|uniref:hypothetical protein n=1 Tax=Stenotrophomonas sp. Marseille-Q4652 TaxID=2866595 RepID=UPI001CE49668|nr:hypothetical protein [Stenotrophomonas sp. Marseille-Q4652]